MLVVVEQSLGDVECDDVPPLFGFTRSGRHQPYNQLTQLTQLASYTCGALFLASHDLKVSFVIIIIIII